VRLIVTLLAALVLGLGLSACGETDQARQDLEERADRVREQVRSEVERRTARIRARIEEVIGQMEQAVPQAQRTAPEVRSQGRTSETEIGRFLDGVLTNIDRYWTRTFAESNLPEPRVAFENVQVGERARTGCRVVADDSAAFYCPSDDTIYIAERFASDLYNGVARGLPGQSAGYGRAAGDFGVAYVVAHEYAHNLQHELGIFSIGRANSAKPFELQADCLAGTWGNSVYRQGLLDEGDVEEALGTALAVGDFDVGNEQHHGTPEERRAAWSLGFESGNPADCQRYVPAA
jgi:hypothetical protein